MRCGDTAGAGSWPIASPPIRPLSMPDRFAEILVAVRDPVRPSLLGAGQTCVDRRDPDAEPPPGDERVAFRGPCARGGSLPLAASSAARHRACDSTAILFSGADLGRRAARSDRSGAQRYGRAPPQQMHRGDSHHPRPSQFARWRPPQDERTALDESAHARAHALESGFGSAARLSPHCRRTGLPDAGSSRRARAGRLHPDPGLPLADARVLIHVSDGRFKVLLCPNARRQAGISAPLPLTRRSPNLPRRGRPT